MLFLYFLPIRLKLLFELSQICENKSCFPILIEQQQARITKSITVIATLKQCINNDFSNI